MLRLLALNKLHREHQRASMWNVLQRVAAHHGMRVEELREEPPCEGTIVEEEDRDANDEETFATRCSSEEKVEWLIDNVDDMDEFFETRVSQPPTTPTTRVGVLGLIGVTQP